MFTSKLTPSSAKELNISTIFFFWSDGETQWSVTFTLSSSMGATFIFRDASNPKDFFISLGFDPVIHSSDKPHKWVIEPVQCQGITAS